MDMSDIELLKSTGFYKKDPITKEEGITLAGIMLFGKDRTILNVNPYCRTDALLRIDDLDRYDDRDFIATNLLDMYDRLIDFISKYTKDRFTLNSENIRVSAMSIIAREMVLNSIMHRSITDGHMSRLIIYEDRMIMENPNSFSTMGFITINNCIPFAKNPTLANFFREIGYADELGSGVKRITENSIFYSGKPPIFEDKEMFRLVVPLTRDTQLNENEIDTSKIDTATENNLINETLKMLLYILDEQKDVTAKDIALQLNKSEKTIKRYLMELKEKGYIERIGSKKFGLWKVIKKPKKTEE